MKRQKERLRIRLDTFCIIHWQIKVYNSDLFKQKLEKSKVKKSGKFPHVLTVQLQPHWQLPFCILQNLENAGKPIWGCLLRRGPLSKVIPISSLSQAFGTALCHATLCHLSAMHWGREHWEATGPFSWPDSEEKERKKEKCCHQWAVVV